MLAVLVYLSLVAACVVVGMTYGRWSVGSCCGCDSFVCVCEAPHTASFYQVTFDGIEDTTPPNGDSCLLCDFLDLTVILSPSFTVCDWNVFLGDVDFCGTVSGSFPGYYRMRRSFVSLAIGRPIPGKSVTSGYIPLRVLFRAEVYSFTGGLPRLYGGVWFYDEAAESSPGSGTHPCDADLDGEVLSYDSAVTGEDYDFSLYCDFSAATATIGYVS